MYAWLPSNIFSKYAFGNASDQSLQKVPNQILSYCEEEYFILTMCS